MFLAWEPAHEKRVYERANRICAQHDCVVEGIRDGIRVTEKHNKDEKPRSHTGVLLARQSFFGFASEALREDMLLCGQTALAPPITCRAAAALAIVAQWMRGNLHTSPWRQQEDS